MGNGVVLNVKRMRKRRVRIPAIKGVTRGSGVGNLCKFRTRVNGLSRRCITVAIHCKGNITSKDHNAVFFQHTIISCLAR